jgi:MinD superfamily P-loop ATPase
VVIARVLTCENKPEAKPDILIWEKQSLECLSCLSRSNNNEIMNVIKPEHGSTLVETSCSGSGYCSIRSSKDEKLSVNAQRLGEIA